MEDLCHGALVHEDELLALRVKGVGLCGCQRVREQCTCSRVCAPGRHTVLWWSTVWKPLFYWGAAEELGCSPQHAFLCLLRYQSLNLTHVPEYSAPIYEFRWQRHRAWHREVASGARERACSAETTVSLRENRRLGSPPAGHPDWRESMNVDPQGLPESDPPSSCVANLTLKIWF